MQYESTITVQAQSCPGVTFTVLRMSFGRRLEFAKQAQLLGQKLEFHKAGESSADKIDAAIVSAEIDRLYLDWGLIQIEGLTIDGEPATTKSLAEAGPEELCREILRTIKRECHLSEEQEKN